MYNKINTGQVYKKEIVSKIKEKTGFWKKDIELMLLALGEVITEAVEEDKSISLKGILTITPIMTKDRMRYNRYKGEMVQEQGHQKVIITAGEQLDKAVVKSLERGKESIIRPIIKIEKRRKRNKNNQNLRVSLNHNSAQFRALFRLKN